MGQEVLAKDPGDGNDALACSALGVHEGAPGVQAALDLDAHRREIELTPVQRPQFSLANSCVQGCGP